MSGVIKLMDRKKLNTWWICLAWLLRLKWRRRRMHCDGLEMF